MRREIVKPAVEPGEATRFIRARQLHGVQPEMIAPSTLHPSESAAMAMTRSSPLATLLAGHVLRDGETVLLVLKPSLWFIIFQSMVFAAAVGLLVFCASAVGERRVSIHRVVYLEAGIFVIAGRVMWSVLQWMGRLYVLTDQRMIRLAGVFSVDLHDCPLRRISRTQIVAGPKDRICRVGSIEIIPKDEAENLALGTWQTIGQPIEVNEQIVAALRRAQNGS